MKFVGAHQPHRADSNYWNDSFGGHTIVNKNHIDSKSNKTSSSSSNPKISGNQNNYPYQECASSFCTDSETNQRKTLIGGTETARLCENDEGEKDEMHREIVCASPGSKRSVLGCCKVSDVIRSVAAVIDSNMMRAQQSFSLQSSSKLISFLHDRQQFRFSSRCFFVVLLILLCTFTNHVSCDENENGSSLGPEFTTLSLVTVPTTPPFDNATRGNKKFGDRCEDTMECGFPGSVCDPRKKSCQCIEDLPVTNHLDKCGKEAAINESCFFNEQCEAFHFQTKCVDNRCVCRFDMSPVVNKDGNVECKGKQMKHDEVERYVDPAMIGVLVGMALMFIIICVVLRLFSRARWRENRTIFNTPNPRLMNVSLLRDNKLMHGQERRGSRMSVRAPSRQPSMASLRPHSPNPSLGKAGSTPGSRGSSNASATSGRSALAASINTDPKPTANCADSNQTLIVTNIIENPAAESVSVEILQPKSNRNQ